MFRTNVANHSKKIIHVSRTPDSGKMKGEFCFVFISLSETCWTSYNNIYSRVHSTNLSKFTCLILYQHTNIGHRNGLLAAFSQNFQERQIQEYYYKTKKTNVTKFLLQDIKTKQLQWYGDVQRMEEGRLPKEVIKWRPPGRRKRGRPKLTWAEEIKGLMGEKGLMEEDWNDRSNWRKKII